MDKTIDRWTDPDGNGYAFKDTVARAQNRATIDKMNAETTDRKSELDIERKRIDNLVRDLPNSTGEYQQSKMVLHGYGNAAVKCGTASGQYANVPAFTTDTEGTLSSLYTKKSNYQIAVNKAGLYLFELRIHINSLTANKRVELAPFVNGERNAALASSYNTAGNFTLTKIATLPIWLSANDTIDFRIAPIEAAEVSVGLGDVLVYAIDWDGKFKIPDYTGYVNETKDLRVGVDGTTYDTAGQAMREQIGLLKEDFNTIIPAYELGDINDSGSITTSNRVVSDFIPRKKETKQLVIIINNNNHSNGYSYRIAKYDLNKNFIDYTSNWNSSISNNRQILDTRNNLYRIKFDDVGNNGKNMPTIAEVKKDVEYMDIAQAYIEEKSITLDKMQKAYTYGNISIVTSSIPNIDTSTGILDFGDEITVTVGDCKKYLHNLSNYESDIRFVNLKPNSGTDYITSNILLVFNIDTCIFRTVSMVNGDRKDNDIIVGGIKINYGDTYKNFVLAHLPFLYTVDGDAPIKQSITIEDESINEKKLINTIGVNNELPSFLEDEYKKVMRNLFEKTTPSTFSFGFATDLHFSAQNSGFSEDSLRDRNKRNFIALGRLSNEYPLDVCVLGGDYQQQPGPNDGQTKQMGIDTIYDVNHWFGRVACSKIAIPGNHEHNYAGGSNGFGLSDDEIFCLLTKKYIDKNIKKANNKVLYTICEPSNVVYVYIAKALWDYDTEVEDGLKIVCEKNIENYPLVVFNHYSVSNSGEFSYEVVTRSIDYLLEHNQKIIAWIGGHNHSDWDNTYKNVLVISCLQSGAWSSEQSIDGITYEHTNLTATESAFSIFTVDQRNKKIYCTRFGLGEDRQWTYVG